MSFLNRRAHDLCGADVRMILLIIHPLFGCVWGGTFAMPEFPEQNIKYF